MPDKACGLDMNIRMQEQLVGANDKHAVEILKIIERDEVGHVLFGSKWFKYMCEEQELDAVDTFKDLITQYRSHSDQKSYRA